MQDRRWGQDCGVVIAQGQGPGQSRNLLVICPRGGCWFHKQGPAAASGTGAQREMQKQIAALPQTLTLCCHLPFILALGPTSPSRSHVSLPDCLKPHPIHLAECALLTGVPSWSPWRPDSPVLSIWYPQWWGTRESGHHTTTAPGPCWARWG